MCASGFGSGQNWPAHVEAANQRRARSCICGGVTGEMSEQQLTVADVVEMLQASDRDACLFNVKEAVARLMEPETRMLKERHLRDVANKLDAALKAVDGMPPDWRCEAFRRDLDRIRRGFTSVADHQRFDRGGRGKSADYLQKFNAAHEAFMLIMTWGQHPPTATDDTFHNVTGALFEIATSASPGDLNTVCGQVITEMKGLGYDPAKPLEQHRSEAKGRITTRANLPQTES